MNLHRRAAEAANRQGPAHRGRLARLRRGVRRRRAAPRSRARIIAHRPQRGRPPHARGRGKARENGDGLFVLDLAEVGVEHADGAEARRRCEADEIVGFAPQRRQRLARGDGNGERQRLRAAAADRLQRGARGRAGGDAVVDEDGGAAGDLDARPIADEPPPRVFELGARALRRRREGALVDSGGADDRFVARDDRRLALDQRAHRQFRLPRRADLAHQHDVERRGERRRRSRRRPAGRRAAAPARPGRGHGRNASACARRRPASARSANRIGAP